MLFIFLNDALPSLHQVLQPFMVVSSRFAVYDIELIECRYQNNCLVLSENKFTFSVLFDINHQFV